MIAVRGSLFPAIGTVDGAPNKPPSGLLVERLAQQWSRLMVHTIPKTSS